MSFIDHLILKTMKINNLVELLCHAKECDKLKISNKISEIDHRRLYTLCSDQAVRIKDGQPVFL